MFFGALRHVGSSALTMDWIRIPCIWRPSPNHWTTRRSLGTQFWSSSGDQEEAPVWCFRANISKMILATRPGKNRLNVLSFTDLNFFNHRKGCFCLLLFMQPLINTWDPLYTPPPSFSRLLTCCKARVSEGPVLGERLMRNEPRMPSSGAECTASSLSSCTLSLLPQLNTQAFSDHFSQARLTLYPGFWCGSPCVIMSPRLGSAVRVKIPEGKLFPLCPYLKEPAVRGFVKRFILVFKTIAIQQVLNLKKPSSNIEVMKNLTQGP